MAKKTIFVPEKEFEDVPDKFSESSGIVKVELSVHTNGIVLNSLKEVELVLRIHNGELPITPLSSIATNLDLVRNMYKASGPLGAGLALMSRDLMEGLDFVGTMIAEAKCNLATKGEYHRSYDYDATGTNFLKTSVRVRQVNGKFVLNIGAGYVGSQPERELAHLIGRGVAFSSIDIEAYMSIADSWWYNLDLKSVLGGISYFTKEDWPSMARVLAHEEYGHTLTLPIKKDDVPLAITVGVEYSRYYFNKESGERGSKDYVKAIGGNIAGASWNTHRYEDAEVKPEKKKLKLNIYFLTGSFDSPPVIDPEKTEKLATVAREIEENLLQKVA